MFMFLKNLASLSMSPPSIELAKQRGPMQSAARIFIAAAFVLSAALLISQPAPREQVGPLPGGAFLLNSGWRLDPVGKQIPLDTFPMATVLTRDGKYMFVLHGGYRPPSIGIIDTSSGQVTGRVAVPDAWLGLTLSPSGDRLYVGGGSKAAIFEFAFTNGTLTAARTFPVVADNRRGNQDFIGDVTLSPDGRLLYAADLYRDSLVVINPQSGMLINRIKTGPLLLGAALAIVLAYTVFAASYFLFAVFLTGFVVVLLDLLGETASHPLGTRLLSTLLGGVIALVASH